ncbi:hypothetical protein D0962_34515 [Leptolyngbyaceae cyanobacterium CCMR0082]|uniref:Uncharacterized protein n=1 Tax=Adonisia turfae CCMR0082 TaxID=2304604 RepID=A0A6M0SJX9_9CYAN|nr:hypothetical protein [Adonisia turfae]NEZ67812.1 hypothetical protein [Adonisia turfae CCMR0082]
MKKRRLISDDEIVKNEGLTEVFSREELATAFECGEWQIRRDLKLLFGDTYKGGKRIFIEDAWLLYLADLKRYALRLISERRGVMNPRVSPSRIYAWLNSFAGNDNDQLEQQKQAAICLGGSWQDFMQRVAKGKVTRLNGITIDVTPVAA